MDKRFYTGIGMGMAAAASVAMLAWPTRSRRHRMVMKTLSKVAEDLSGAMKKF